MDAHAHQPTAKVAVCDPNFILLYVESPAASAAFYADLLGRPPVEASPTFAMFGLASGVMLGLWGASCGRACRERHRRRRDRVCGR